MAKKLKISSEEKEKFVDKVIFKKEQNDNDKKIKDENKKSDLLKLFSIIGNIVLVIVVFILLVVNDNTKKEMQDEIDSIDTTCAYKSEFQCMMNYSDEIEKAKILDDNIVFVLEGYGNVYYTYDCVNKLTAGSKYSYWVYNRETAIGEGYRAGKC